MHFVKCLSVLFILTESYLTNCALYADIFILGTAIGQDVISGNTRSSPDFEIKTGGTLKCGGRVTCAMFHSFILRGGIVDGFS